MNDIDSLIFTTSARVVSRATDAQLLSKAKSRALDPAIFDQYPPFLWQSEISSDRLDAYYTVMDPETTLRNYAKDAAAGVAVLLGHDSSALPTGHSLTGTLEQDGDVTRVLSDAYALTEPATETVINKLRAGIARDVSVGFSARGAQCVCSICQRDMWRDYRCWHIPGLRYKRTDNKDDAVTDPNGELATGTIVGAHLSEYSLVYDGATPGAAVLQAQRAAEAGKLGDRDIRLLEQLPCFRAVRLPTKRIQTQGVTMAKELETDRDAAEVDAGVFRAVQAIVERVAPKGSTIEQGIAWMDGEIKRLTPLARDGETYRTDLIEAGIKEAVRAMGAEKGEQKRAQLEKLDLETIKDMTATWREMGDRALPGGRLSNDESGAGDGAKVPGPRKVKIGGLSRA